MWHTKKILTSLLAVFFTVPAYAIDIATRPDLGVATSSDCMVGFDASAAVEERVRKVCFDGNTVTFLNGVGAFVDLSTVFQPLGASDVVDDTTPQLGGNLDMQTFNIEGVDATEFGYIDGVTSGVQAQLTANAGDIDSLEAKLPDGGDESYGLLIDNNTTRTPTAASMELYPEANVWKMNSNGTEDTILGKLDVDDTPVDGATDVPASSNRLYDHENATNPHGVVATEVDPTVDSSAEVVAIINTTPSTLIADDAIAATIARDSELLTVISGTSSMGTASIASGACAATVTTTATGAATTDVISGNFNASPLAVTGYAASADGGLFIYAWPTANNVNFSVCNNTADAITPGAVTLNWKIIK